MQYDVVVLTDDKYIKPKELNWYSLQVLLEDEMVVDGLQQQGLTAIRKSWSDSSFDWSKTRAVLFRTTWDYFERFAEIFPMVVSDQLEDTSDQRRSKRFNGI